MKKTMLTLGIVCTLLNACAYKPIIDTAGRSGTFDSDQAKEITNDTQHGKKYHDDDNTKHYHWYFPRLGSWNHAEKRIFNDLQKGVIKIEERI